MKHFLLLIALASTGCASLGRYPGQSDVGCIRQQMAPPANWVFDMAVSRCIAPVGGQALTGAGAYYPPLHLHGAPDLQADARATGFTYTD